MLRVGSLAVPGCEVDAAVEVAWGGSSSAAVGFYWRRMR
ncbi:hypothetical protein KC8_13685 [Sphingomonas sp. KC8]|nr:hypothetical protein KC8_13685 [Sphingomonas sp. KC8]